VVSFVVTRWKNSPYLPPPSFFSVLFFLFLWSGWEVIPLFFSFFSIFLTFPCPQAQQTCVTCRNFIVSPFCTFPRLVPILAELLQVRPAHSLVSHALLPLTPYRSHDPSPGLRQKWTRRLVSPSVMALFVLLCFFILFLTLSDFIYLFFFRFSYPFVVVLLLPSLRCLISSRFSVFSLSFVPAAHPIKSSNGSVAKTFIVP